ncbi:MAG: 2-amino-4-hydroxy-6-hydroxymethyldihydropteridine diphosphokinase [Candidatus Sedimenticola sp. (ex Thyasira tokunagai)]
MFRVWLSIGSNIERERNIRGALQALRERFGELILSDVYESEAVGFDGSPFYNLVAGFETTLSAGELMAELRGIEAAYGRQRGDERFAPRTLDIDILTYGDRVMNYEGQELPRDEIIRYAFVLLPLSEVAGEEMHPLTGKSYRQLWDEFDKTDQALWPVDFP